MMILLCELAIKSEGIRFRLLWTKNNYQAVIIFNNFFPPSDTFKWTRVFHGSITYHLNGNYFYSHVPYEATNQ